MKQILTKEMVKQALDGLKADGKKTTNAMLHAALGHRRSMTTVIRLRAELEADKSAPNDSAEGLKTFRAVWDLAKEEGRKQQEFVIDDLKINMADLIRENERLEGEKAALASQADDARKAKGEAEAELANVRFQLSKSQESLIQAGESAKAALERIATEQASHQATQMKVAEANQKAHELELELVKCRTRLEVKDGHASKQD